MRRIVRYIPDFITSLNLVSGLLGVVFISGGRVGPAFVMMLAAAVFDFCDGLAARALNSCSAVGKELDSLSDTVSFGVLPALMLMQMMRSCTFTSGIVTYIPLLLAVFSALRLAIFNVDESQKHSFKGLATPMCALFCASLCYYVAAEPVSLPATLCAWELTVPLLTVVLCALLVCRVPMFSMKFTPEDSRALRFKRVSFLVEAVIIAAVVIAVGTDFSIAVTLVCLLYILKNLAYALFRV